MEDVGEIWGDHPSTETLRTRRRSGLVRVRVRARVRVGVRVRVSGGLG